MKRRKDTEQTSYGGRISGLSAGDDVGRREKQPAVHAALARRKDALSRTRG